MAGMFDRYFTEDEEKQLFSTVKSRSGLLAARDYAWMRLFRATGMRVGAMSQLTVGHARVALRTGYLDLQSDIQKKGIEHRIFVTKACRRALRDLLHIRRDMGYPETDDGGLIMSRNHKPMSIRSYQARMNYWCGKSGDSLLSSGRKSETVPSFPRATPHWFRHTVGKRIMKNSTAADPRGVAQGVLGHISGRSTEIYTRPDKEDIEMAMREVC